MKLKNPLKNFEKNLEKNKNLVKVKLAAIAKDEAAYIPLWVYHHLRFGFDSIDLWINASNDNSIEILKKIKEKNSVKINFFDADNFLKKCLNENKNFQVEAYNAIYKLSKDQGFTHLIFLDLDEYWMPKNGITCIQDFVKNFQKADAISFKWYLDTPSPDTKKFPLPVDCKLLQRNRHVKTLLKISERVKKIDIHNHQIENGNYMLADGSVFRDTDQDQHERALVAVDDFHKNKDSIEDFFILHMLYRSETEYLSTLLRGRGHTGDVDVFKMNRWGYICDSGSMPGFEIKIPSEVISGYCDGFDEFLYDCDLKALLLDSVAYIEDRYNRLISILKDQPYLIDKKLQNQLRGVRLPDDLEIHRKEIIQSSIDQIKLSSNNSELEISGWGFGKDKVLNIDAVLKDEMLIKSKSIKRFDRPDVSAVHSEAALLQPVGFKVNFDLNFNDSILNNFCENTFHILLGFENGNSKLVEVNAEDNFKKIPSTFVKYFNPVVLLADALSLRGAGDLGKSIELLKFGAKHYPKFLDQYEHAAFSKELVRTFLNQAKFDDAFENIKTYNIKESDYVVIVARAYSKFEDLENARLWWKKVLEIFPKSSEALSFFESHPPCPSGVV